MFGVDFSELMVILVVALIVIGPERLPKVARTFGHVWGRAQRFVNSVKADLDGAKVDIARGMSVEEFHQMQQKMNQEVLRAEQAASQITQTVNQQVQQVNSSVVQLELPSTEQKKTPH
ncbi:MAG: twin-arginine translocase TatA/TatE family subunit [Gallionella sp.]|nr:twin-arginine translocase TatA/TatE family subunit [Gallionella sp.]